MTRAERYPPDFCDWPDLAYRLRVSEHALRQYHKRGLLPPRVKIGDCLRWRWVDVEAAFVGVDHAPQPDNSDQFIAGLARVGHVEAKATATRAESEKSDGARVLPISKASRDTKRQ